MNTRNLTSTSKCKSFCFAAAFLFSCSAGFATANPTGGSVVSGDVVFEVPTEGTLNVYNSPGAIIEWQDFSIGVDELTRFIQESTRSTVLNRVTGSNISEIMGQLTSNGQVFLVNPHGTLIGPNAVINTSSFVVSSLDLKDHDFLSNHLQFTGNGESGDVINSGMIRSGNILLIAPKIENRGSLVSETGQITLAAGESMLVTSLDQPEIQFQVQSAESAVLNLGEISSLGGAIDVFASTIQHQGSISADAARVDQHGNIRLIAAQDINLEPGSLLSATGPEGGEIQLHNNGGTSWVRGVIEATGSDGEGGVVTLTGDRIGIDDGASIDASGQTGGGSIYIGGSQEGQGPLPNASAIAILPDALIQANALKDGDGGTIIAFAEDVAKIHGVLEARGGTHGGNGGFIETSGWHHLDLTTTPDVGAPAGMGGTWLLDPTDIVIGNFSNDANITSTSPFEWDGTGTPAQLSILSLLRALAGGQLIGGQVVIRTTANSGSGNGDITLATNLDSANILCGQTSGTCTSTLNLDAVGSIFLDADITRASTNNVLNLVLSAASSGMVRVNNIDLGAGTLTLNNGTLQSNGTITGNVTVNGTLAPGSSPGTMTIIGTLTLGPTSITQFELAGYDQGSTYDLLNVVGNLNISPGALAQIDPTGGFSPFLGIPFNLVNYQGLPNGPFSNFNAPFLLNQTFGAGQISITPFGTSGVANPPIAADVLALADDDGVFDSELSGDGAQELPGGENEPARTMLTSDLGDRFIWCE